jgi:hypothetical protein
MTAISGILYKITCASETPTTMFQDQTRLLTMDLSGASDAEILDYIKYHKLVRFAIKNSTDQAPWFFFCDKIKDTGFYYWIDCKTAESFKAIENGKLYQTTYLSKRQKIFTALNWVDHGYKIVDSKLDLSSWYPNTGPRKFQDYSIFNKEIAEQIWNQS